MSSWTQEDLDRRNREFMITPEMQATMDANYRAYVAHGIATQEPRRGRMNKLETAYARHLEELKHQDEVIWFDFEPFKVRLANGAWYTPDFAVMLWSTKGGETTARLEFHECKGHWREAARVRIKVAADKYPFRFVAVTKERKTGEWRYEYFTGRASDAR